MKILIYLDEIYLKHEGGVAGYCYNLANECKKRNDCEIEFVNDNNRINTIYEKVKTKNIPYYLYRTKTKFFKALYREEYNTVEYFEYVKYMSKHKPIKDFSEYDAVHFHSTFSLYMELNSLENYKGKVFLTSHSPIVFYKELLDDVSFMMYKRFKKILDNGIVFDEEAFKRADCIIFPCKEAEEPYYHSWDDYKNIRKFKEIRYMLTGTEPVNIKSSREEIRRKFNIPSDAKVISFVGRHNEIKGYDILQDIFTRISDVYVICCGKIKNIKPPISERWIEVGWTDDPYSIVGASDIYILPNRETYFDLAMLETLSIGKCSVISNTGGNKVLSDIPGIFTYNDINDAVNQINYVFSMNKKEKMQLESRQREVFERTYTNSVFYDRYKRTIREAMAKYE